MSFDKLLAEACKETIDHYISKHAFQTVLLLLVLLNALDAKEAKMRQNTKAAYFYLFLCGRVFLIFKFRSENYKKENVSDFLRFPFLNANLAIKLQDL